MRNGVADGKSRKNTVTDAWILANVGTTTYSYPVPCMVVVSGAWWVVKCGIRIGHTPIPVTELLIPVTSCHCSL